VTKRAYDLDELLARLAGGEVVPVDEEDWRDWRGRFTTVDTVASTLGGDKRIVRWPVPTSRRKGWALVEEPEPGLLAVRPLKNLEEARALIAERLAAYERMWDG